MVDRRKGEQEDRREGDREKESISFRVLGQVHFFFFLSVASNHESSPLLYATF